MFTRAGRVAACSWLIACGDGTGKPERPGPPNSGPQDVAPLDAGSRLEAGVQSSSGAATLDAATLDAAVAAPSAAEASVPELNNDAGVSCADPLRACGAECVDLLGSREHCGACDTRCSTHELCDQGACRAQVSCSDACPKAGGIDWLCRLRFMYGINYAWHHFGADFGGNARWMQPGVSQNPDVDVELADMAQNGVDVVRWWVFPDFRGDGVAFDDSDHPTGLGGSVLADLARALELSEKNDLYLMLTLFSFDNFRPTNEMSGVRARSIRPLVVDAEQRKNLMEKVVRPFARAVAQSPYAARVIAWDAINEPEWAISGPSLYGGDPMFDLNPDLEGVSHGQMEAFLRDVLEVLRDETESLLSVGSAAIKWRHAWDQLDLDFYQFHIYDWVDMDWPYDRSPEDYGLSERPLVMGEFPLGGLSRAPYSTLLSSWYGNAYAGALGWAYTDGNPGLGEVKGFAAQHPCELRF